MKTEMKEKLAAGRASKKFTIVMPVIVIAALAAIIGGIVMFFRSASPPNGKYDAFAQCLKDNGAIFYGTFWCPYCQKQKAMFGDSARLLPYVECSLPDASGRTGVCIANGIQKYPTWVFKDSSRLVGQITLETLSEKTSCALPQQ